VEKTVVSTTFLIHGIKIKKKKKKEEEGKENRPHSEASNKYTAGECTQ
jgi:hypothetical protein